MAGWIEKREFGVTSSGGRADLYMLSSASGAWVSISNYGGTIVDLQTHDRTGRLTSAVLGFDDLASYEGANPFFGATVGRFANRICEGRFTLDGESYQLPINNGPNSLHGGAIGYDKRIWKATASETANGPALKMSIYDPHGAEGYPGNVHVEILFTLTEPATLVIEYQATSDAATPINLTNHSYFNLKDAGASPVLDHLLELRASRYTPVDWDQIPTGEIATVEGTPLNFRTAKPIGQDILKMPAIPPPSGYDHNIVLDKEPGVLSVGAILSDPDSGRKMEVWTTEPGIQFYSGNFLDGTIVGRGNSYGRYHGVCFEAQHFPDSPNHPNFPSAVLRPGEVYRQRTEYRFS
jgi:aldose 1-epimerase